MSTTTQPTSERYGRQNVTCWMPTPEVEALRELAVVDDVSVSKLIRAAIRRYMAEAGVFDPSPVASTEPTPGVSPDVV